MPAALLAGFLKGKAQAEQLNEQRALQKEKLTFEKKRLDLEEKEAGLKQKMMQDSIQFGQGLSQELEPTRPTPGAVMPSGEQMPSEIIEQPVDTPPALGDNLPPLARKLIQGMLQQGNLGGAYQEAAPFFTPRLSPPGTETIDPVTGRVIHKSDFKPTEEKPPTYGNEFEQVSMELFGRIANTQDEFAKVNKTIQDRRIQAAGDKTKATEDQKPLSAETQQAVTVFDNTKRVAQSLMQEFTPEQRAAYVGFLNFPAARVAQIGKSDPKFARFQTLINEAKNQAFGEGGKALTSLEASIVFGFIPTGKEFSAADFEAKLGETLARADFLRSRRIHYATKSKKELAAEDGSDSVSGKIAPPSDAKAIGYYQMSDGSKQYWDGKSWQKSKP